MAHPLFGPEVRLMLEEDDPAQIQAFCETLHPATVAETLEGEFDVEQVWRFLSHTGIKTQAAIFEYFPLEWQIKMVEGSGQQQAARLIEKMSHDDRVDLVRRLRPVVAENLLRLVDEADRRDIATLQAQKPNTAGALMTTDYAWVPGNITVAEAFDKLRLQAPDSETIYYVFVLDADRKLQGVLTLRKLVLAARQALISNVMERNVVSVKPGDDQESVAEIMRRYDLIAIPVVDDDNRLIGIVTHDDVIDVVVKEANEDAYHMGAVSNLEENYLEANFVTIWRKRSVWLACLFVAELFTFTALAHFEDALEHVVVLSLFVPLVISTGGNSGSQAATLITRAMALGHVHIRQWFAVLRHEIVMGLALGVTLGAIGYVRAALTPTDTLRGVPWSDLAVTIGMAVMAICIWGTLVGAMLPLVFRRFGFDPAFASSPFVATFVDVTGIIIYFTIATIWIPGLAPPSFKEELVFEADTRVALVQTEPAIERRKLKIAPATDQRGQMIEIPPAPVRRQLNISAAANDGEIEIVAFLAKNQKTVEHQFRNDALLAHGDARIEALVPANESAVVWVRSMRPITSKIKLTIATYDLSD
jgi:magnesium transporter